MSLTKVTYSMINGAVFNVLDYGALGDNSNDDTAAINAAITAANAAGGGTVFLPAGTYLVTPSDDADLYGVVLKSKVHLTGAGKYDTIIKMKDGSNILKGIVWIEPSSSFVEISQMTINANRNTVVGSSSGCPINGGHSCAWLTFRNMRIVNSFARGLQTNGDNDGVNTSYVTIEDVEFNNAGSKAIMVRRTNYATVKGSVINMNPRDVETSASGVEVSMSAFVSISGATIKHERFDYGHGYRVVNGSAYVSIEGGVVNGGKNGVYISDSRQVSVSGVVSTTNYGFWVWSADVGSLGYITSDISITNCIIRNAYSTGIYVQTTDNSTGIDNLLISNNIIDDAGGGNMSYGIKLYPNVAAIDCQQLNNIVVGATAADYDPPGDFTANAPVQTDYIWTNELVFSNNTAVSIDVPTIGNYVGIFELCLVDSAQYTVGISYTATGTPNATALYNGRPSNIDVTTGILTGTTGTVGHLTVSAANNGKVYVENRTGSGARFRYSFRICR